jgi:hypothetical protein
LGSLPKLDTARLHKIADQISRKADAESFDVISTLLTELLRRAARAQAVGTGVSLSPLSALPLDRALQVWDKTRSTFALAENANLDKKLAFVNAVSDIRRAVA